VIRKRRTTAGRRYLRGPHQAARAVDVGTDQARLPLQVPQSGLLLVYVILCGMSVEELRPYLRQVREFFWASGGLSS